VGALTVKEFRFKQRVWFLKNTPSICAGCARGCNVQLGINQNRIWRITPRDNDEVNQSWICDEGRLSHLRTQEGERLGAARARPAGGAAAADVVPETALEQAAALLTETARRHGGAAVAAITSGHASLEEQVALKALLDRIGGTAIALPEHAAGEDDALLIRKDKTANSFGARLSGANLTMAELLTAVGTGRIRALIVLREDPIGEGGPAAAQALGALDFLLTLDWRITPTVAASDLALPVSAFGEMDGSVINFQGRLQLMRPGLTAYREADPGWKPLYEIAARTGGGEVPRNFREAFRRTAQTVPALGGLDTPAVGALGVRLNVAVP
jgi:NADH-quinone oxidoreductase subunit G